MPRRRVRRLVAHLAAALACAPAVAGAQRVVYYTNLDLGQNVLPAALTLLQQERPGLTFVAAASQADFNARLLAGGVDVAIFGEHTGDIFGASRPALTAFLGGGGRVVGATFLRTSGLPRLLGYAGDNSTIRENFAGPLIGTGPLFAGIVGSVPIANPGWNVFDLSYTAADPAACLARYNASPPGQLCAAVLGNGGRSVLLGPLFDTYDQDRGARFVANAVGLVATAVVPEPGTVALVGAGLAGLGLAAARRRR